MANDLSLTFYDEKKLAGLLQAEPTRLNSRKDRIRPGLTLILIILICALNISLGHQSTYFDSLQEAVNAPIRNSQLHILIPIGDPPDLGLCKTVLSAATLNYSTPTILNWGSKFHDFDLPEGGSYVSDMLEIKNYLNEISQEHDEDLVLIIDGSDTWFQLRPNHLIQRYYDLNLAANKLLKQRIRSSAGIKGITQSIIFSSQKPYDEDLSDNISCNTASKLAPDNDTSRPVTIPLDPHSKTQDMLLGCQNLDTSLIIGPVNDLRVLFSAAYELSQHQFTGSSRDLLAQMFREQQYQREILRQQYLPTKWHFLTNLVFRFRVSYKSILASFSTHKQTSQPGNTSYEFGIGLDYSGELASTSPDHAAWIVGNSISQKATRSPSNPASQVDTALPKSLTNSQAPIANAGADAPFAESKSWNEVPLYANTDSGSIPVMVQQAGASDWEKMWWKPHLRKFLEMHLEAERGPIAEVQGRRWWSTIKGRGGVMVKNMGWVGWEELCGGWVGEKEVFGNVEWAEDGRI